MNKRSFSKALVIGCLGAMSGGLAWAQAFPSKPLRVVVPQPPGGGFDVVGRLLADRLGKAMGQSAVVENRPGSGTLVGTDLVAKAPPDGYTLLVGSVSNLALNPGLYPNIPYDSLRDFEPVGLAVAYSYTLVARKDLPFANLRELSAYAKANPKKLTYASGGSGSGQHGRQIQGRSLGHFLGLQGPRVLKVLLHPTPLKTTSKPTHTPTRAPDHTRTPGRTRRHKPHHSPDQARWW
jgi:tripartite-type tricarboxylate transporter receptor subunit TctC